MVLFLQVAVITSIFISFLPCRLSSERIYAIFTDYTHDKVKLTLFASFESISKQIFPFLWNKVKKPEWLLKNIFCNNNITIFF